MSVTDEDPVVHYVGDGTDPSFDFDFPCLSTAHLQVKVVLRSTGAETSLVLTTDFTATLNTDRTGTVTLVDADQAWLTGANLASTYDITIRRVLPIEQPLDIANQGAFYPAVHETAFDRITMIAQQQQEVLDRSIKFADTDDLDAEDSVLPAVAERADKFLKFDSDGIPTAVTTVDPDDITVSAYGETLVDDANAATARATLGGLTKVVATKAALKALSGTDLTGTVLMQDYATAGDGGGGHFYWASASSATDNAGTIIQPDAGGTGRWLRIMNNTVQPEWFGAVGDGTTNDYTAINACLGMLEAGTARVLLLSKQYGVGATSWTGLDLTSATDVAIIGTGWRSGFKQLAAPSQNIQSLTTFLLIDTCTRAKLDNFKIDLNALEHCGVGVKGCTDVDVERVFVTNSPNVVEGDNRPAFQYHSSTRIALRNCRTSSVSASLAFGSLSSTSQCTDGIVEGCIFYDSKSTNSANCSRMVMRGNIFDIQSNTNGAGLEASGTSGGAMTDWVIEGNVFRNCGGIALQLTSLSGTKSISYGVVKNNSFVGSTVNAIDCFGGVDHVTIEGNSIHNCGRGIGLAVTASGGCYNIIVKGNTLVDTESGDDRTMVRGIQIGLAESGSGLTGVQMGPVVVEGNIIRNMKESGIVLTYTSGDATFGYITIKGNTVTDCDEYGLSVATTYSGAHTGALVEGNVFMDNSPADHRYSLFAADAPKWIVANNVSGVPAVGGSGVSPIFLGLTGTGSPEAAYYGYIGSTFHRTDGSTSTSLYVKTANNTTNEGWTAK